MAETALINTLAKGLSRLSTNPVSAKTLINYQPVRHRIWANIRPITGWPRPHLFKKGKKYPEPHKYNWLPYLPEDGSYTVKPLPIFKMGGRDLETGRVVVRTLGGGNKKLFRWVDMFRSANDDGSVKEERVLQLKYSPLHTPKLALVAGQEKTRWILASHDINVGDVIRTYAEIPRNPVRAKVGDAHPLGALPLGTRVHLIEDIPGEGAKFCLVAGSSGEITKRSPDGVVVKLPQGDSFKFDRNCMAVVGLLSNPGHNLVQDWVPQRPRWRGKRPRSGQWHRKDGYCGRKIYPPKFIDITTKARMDKIQRESEEDLFNLG